MLKLSRFKDLKHAIIKVYQKIVENHIQYNV